MAKTKQILTFLSNYSLSGQRAIVILDNASIHHSDRTVELIESTGAVV